MTEPYLICHKVRGEPAFDVAIQLEGSGTLSDPGPWWIILTSGHRAYPFWTAELSVAVKNYLGEGHPKDMNWLLLQMPNNWPDHYQANSQREPKRNLSELTLEDLEL